MKLNQLAPSEGSRKKAYRKGRGYGSGNGKTAGRGANGQNSRSGGGVRIGFEGGQMPLYRRMPKVGFSNARFKDVFAEVNVESLNMFEENELVDEVMLREAGLVKGVCDGIVILGRGELTKKLTIRAERFTKTASEKILAAGGKAQKIGAKAVPTKKAKAIKVKPEVVEEVKPVKAKVEAVVEAKPVKAKAETATEAKPVKAKADTATKAKPAKAKTETADKTKVTKAKAETAKPAKTVKSKSAGGKAEVE